jgi:3-oxoacyl-(acyl-carrier-protein) synthase
VHPDRNGLEPDPEGKGIVAAIQAALKDAGTQADEIDLIIPMGCAIPAFDAAEAAAFRTVFGERLKDVPVWSSKPYVGNCGAAAGALDMAIAAKCVAEQKIPAAINCGQPLGRPCRPPTAAVARMRRSTACWSVLRVSAARTAP